MPHTYQKETGSIGWIDNWNLCVMNSQIAFIMWIATKAEMGLNLPLGVPKMK